MHSYTSSAIFKVYFTPQQVISHPRAGGRSEITGIKKRRRESRFIYILTIQGLSAPSIYRATSPVIHVPQGPLHTIHPT